MDLADRRGAAALKAAERPDVRALRSAVSRVERGFDEVIDLQDMEIQRLRRIILTMVRAYRTMQAASWRGSNTRYKQFTDAMDLVCLEADAIEFSGDLTPKKRPAPKRG